MNNPTNLYTPKHLALELGISEERLAWEVNWAPIGIWTAGDLIRYEIGDLELNELRNALRPLPEPTRGRAKKGRRTAESSRLNAARETDPDSIGADGSALPSEVTSHDHQDFFEDHDCRTGGMDGCLCWEYMQTR